MATEGLAATQQADTARRDALQQRLFAAWGSTNEVFTVYLGLRLGLYERLAARPLTARGLATEAKCDERYAREWLEQQAVAGILEVVRESNDPAAREFRLPAAHAEVLLDRDSLGYFGFGPRQIASVGPRLPDLLRAFRTGDGVAWEAYGEDLTVGQADQNRAFLRQVFPTKYVGAIPDLDARLRADPPARIADLACGAGWCALGLAAAYPKASADGLDLDAEAIQLAKRNARDLGLDARVTFHARDAADPALRGRYDLVTIVEALHDMSRPVEVLRAARGLLATGGSVLVVDERTEESFRAPGPELERLFYGFSVLFCLPNGRASTPSAATGTMMRPAVLERYAREAGFQRLEVLPLEHDFFRFYRLWP